jgi:hypothetical protein
MKTWLFSSDCSGMFHTSSTQPVDQCLQATDGSYFENECSSAKGAPLSVKGLETADVVPAAFDAWKVRFQKEYTAEEHPRRLAAFRASIARVRESENSAHGLTKFSDLTPEEFSARYLRRAAKETEADAPEWDGQCTACKRFPELRNYTGTALDWTQMGAVTMVKDQGQCGSCWSFGTTGDIEGVWFLAGNTLTSLSEQELVSCEKTDDGCNGGLQEDAFPFIIKKGGIAAEKAYPYTSGKGKTGKCKATKERPIAAKISKWNKVSSTSKGEADILKQLPQVGPITIGIDAGPMQDYDSGIDNPKKCKSSRGALDHAVLVVGYGTENGKDYWKIKNSWAADWGEQGYYRIVRGVNKCGLAMDAVHSVA